MSFYAMEMPHQMCLLPPNIRGQVLPLPAASACPRALGVITVSCAGAIGVLSGWGDLCVSHGDDS